MGELKNIPTKAYVVDSKDAPFVLRDVILDGAQENELLVEIKYTGICHTDIVVQHGGMPIGSFPAVLGHEGVGIVRQVGSGTSFTSGDTVLLSFHSCGECQQCLDGQCGGCPHTTDINFISTARRAPGSKSPISLPNGDSVHGQFFGQSSMSKLAIVSERSAVKISARPDDLQYLAPLSCGYLTGAGTVLNVFRPRATNSLAVLGAGAVGLAAIMAAKAVGVGRIIAVDIVDAKLQTASALGATDTINSRSGKDLNSSVREILPDGVDYILDTTGVPVLLELSVKALAHGGTLALVGVPPPTANIQINAIDLLTGCKRIVGVIEALSDPRTLIPQLMQLYHEGKFPIEKVSTTYPADRLDQAIEDLKSGKVIKPILSWEAIQSSI